MNDLDDFLPKEDLNGQELFVQFKNKLQNPKIHNIGVVGRYGAGKSSFINSFFEWYKRNKSELNYDYQVLVRDNKNGEVDVYNASFQEDNILNFTKDNGNDYKVRIKPKKI